MHVCIIGHVTRRSVRLSVLALLLDGPPTGKEKNLRILRHINILLSVITDELPSFSSC